MHIDDVIFVVFFICMHRISLLFSWQLHHQFFYSWCSVVYYYLFLGFNILFAKIYVFIRSSPYVLAISKKCGHVLKIMMQEIRCCYRNFIWMFPLGFMNFFLFQTYLHVDDVIILSYLHAYTYLFSLCAQTVIFIMLKWAHHA